MIIRQILKRLRYNIKIRFDPIYIIIRLADKMSLEDLTIASGYLNALIKHEEEKECCN